jgi:hypothetical protein
MEMMCFPTWFESDTEIGGRTEKDRVAADFWNDMGISKRSIGETSKRLTLRDGSESRNKPARISKYSFNRSIIHFCTAAAAASGDSSPDPFFVLPASPCPPAAVGTKCPSDKIFTHAR